MSLFKFREYWSVKQLLSTPNAKKEEFHSHSLVVGNLDNAEDRKDKIATGSLDGVLRIFFPKEKTFKSDDLMLEKIFDEGIIQIELGRFKEGSKDLVLGVLFPRKFSVFQVINASKGDTIMSHFQLKELYTHKLKRLAYNMCCGSFGNSFGKDFVCIQSFDGQLTFYEQDKPIFGRYLPEHLVPGPLAYFKQTDSIITFSADLKLQCVKYQSLISSLGKGETSEIEGSGGKRLKFDWEVLLGEEIYDIKIARYSKHLAANQYEIIALGERTLFTLNQNGKVTSQKRLDYFPSAICPFFNLHDTSRNKRHKLIIGTHNKSLMILEDPKLIWSATAEVIPFCVKVGSFGEKDGLIVVLSDDGTLMIGYLGTDPGTKKVIKIEKKELDYVKMEKEHNRLKQLIRKSIKEGIKQTEKKIALNVKVPRSIDSIRETNKLQTSINIQITYTGSEAINNLSLDLGLPPEFASDRPNISYSSFKGQPDPTNIKNVIFRKSGDEDDNEGMDQENILSEIPNSLECSVTTFFYEKNGEPNVISKMFNLPITMIGQAVNPSPTNNFSLILRTNEKVVNLEHLFSDVIEATPEQVNVAENVFSFQYFKGDTVTILSSKKTGAYKFQAGKLSSFYFMLNDFIKRLKRHSNSIKFQVEGIPIAQYCDVIERHFIKRIELQKLEKKLDGYAEQFRLIQKRLLIKFKDKNPSTLNGMDQIFEVTYKQILDLSFVIESKQKAFKTIQKELSCCTRLINLLFKYKYNHLDERDIYILQGCLTPIINESSQLGWEEQTLASLKFLFSTVLAKNTKEKSNFPRELKKLEDISNPKDFIYKFKKFIVGLQKRIEDGGKLYIQKKTNPNPNEKQKK